MTRPLSLTHMHAMVVPPHCQVLLVLIQNVSITPDLIPALSCIAAFSWGLFLAVGQSRPLAGDTNKCSYPFEKDKKS